LRQRKDGGIEFNEGPQREQADKTLMTAHNLILKVLDLQKEYFKLDDLQQPLQKCFKDFQLIWRKQE
jgi:hypothetical protein